MASPTRGRGDRTSRQPVYSFLPLALLPDVVSKPGFYDRIRSGRIAGPPIDQVEVLGVDKVSDQCSSLRIGHRIDNRRMDNDAVPLLMSETKRPVHKPGNSMHTRFKIRRFGGGNHQHDQVRFCRAHQIFRKIVPVQTMIFR